MALPTQAAIRARILKALVATVTGDLDNGSEYMFDLVEWDKLTATQRLEYQRRLEAAADTIIRRLRSDKV